MSGLLRCVLAVLLALSAATGARADERILAFDSAIRIAADGSLEVTETITVRAEGDQIRRGLYRDFPTRYVDGRGLRHSVDFEVVSLQRDDQPEPWFTESLSNGVRVNFGNDDFLPVPGEFKYSLRYRTRRQIGFFDQHDELYWNVTGNDWVFPIDTASARIELPQAVPANDLRLDAYTGPAGSRGNATTAEKADGVVTWTLSAGLAPGEGMTVALGFPKGVVRAPSSGERVGWWLRDLAGPIVVGFAWISLFGFYLSLWRKIGRDPPAGTIIVQYEPPPDHSPAGLRFLRRYGYDPVCFSADAVALGVAGVLRIEREKGFFKDEWTLKSETTDAANNSRLTSSLKVLAASLFKGKREVELTPANRSLLMNTKSVHESALKRQYQPRYFETNYGWVGLGFLVAAVATVPAVVLSRGNEPSVLLSIVGGAVMVVTAIVFAFLLRRPTIEGRKLLDYCEGLRRYMSVAERDELASLTSHEPRLDAARYQALLPYALALDVESAWTKRFTAAVGEAAAEAAARSARWVGGSGFSGSSLTDMGSSLSSSFSSQIASSSSPPGSSSGGGGGGSSGGGGGGGGGGGR